MVVMVPVSGAESLVACVSPPSRDDHFFSKYSSWFVSTTAIPTVNWTCAGGCSVARPGQDLSLIHIFWIWKLTLEICCQPSKNWCHWLGYSVLLLHSMYWAVARSDVTESLTSLRPSHGLPGFQLPADLYFSPCLGIHVSSIRFTCDFQSCLHAFIPSIIDGTLRSFLISSIQRQFLKIYPLTAFKNVISEACIWKYLLHWNPWFTAVRYG